MPWDVNNKTMPFFYHKDCFFGSRTRHKIMKILWEVKNTLSNFLSYWVSKRFVSVPKRILHLVSELRLDNILPLFWPKNCPKIVEIAIMIYFDGFFAKTWAIFGIPSRRTFWTPNMKDNLKIYFFDSIVFSKFCLLSANRKSSFYGRKMSLISYSHPMARD